MKRAPIIASAAFVLTMSASLLAAASPTSAQGLRDLLGDRVENRSDLRELISDRAGN